MFRFKGFTIGGAGIFRRFPLIAAHDIDGLRRAAVAIFPIFTVHHFAQDISGQWAHLLLHVVWARKNKKTGDLSPARTVLSSVSKREDKVILIFD